ncbi:hypothetical protein EI94DRAFT_1709892 [Lactarius quietus]|nr:hypothetical protein EI94DRAFT_1709892 [Lactarius quietus]
MFVGITEYRKNITFLANVGWPMSIGVGSPLVQPSIMEDGQDHYVHWLSPLASRMSMMKQLPHHRMAHFAYHATLEPEQPLDMAYFLGVSNALDDGGHGWRRPCRRLYRGTFVEKEKLVTMGFGLDIVECMVWYWTISSGWANATGMLYWEVWEFKLALKQASQERDRIWADPRWPGI